MAEKVYVIHLGEGARKRHHHQTEKGRVIAFMVRLEIKVEGDIWRPMIRYDCTHDVAHRGRYNIQGEQSKEDVSLSYAEALDLADKDINDNGELYKKQLEPVRSRIRVAELAAS